MRHAVDFEDKNAVFKIKSRMIFKSRRGCSNTLNYFKNKVKFYAFDFSEVGIVDSSGVGILSLAKQRAQLSGGSSVLKHPLEQARRLFETTKLDRTFTAQT